MLIGARLRDMRIDKKPSQGEVVKK